MLTYRIHLKSKSASYLEAHNLDICATLDALSQQCHSHMVFTDQLSFHKLLIHIFTLDLDIVQYPTLHDLINSTEDLKNIFQLFGMQENEY